MKFTMMFNKFLAGVISLTSVIGFGSFPHNVAEDAVFEVQAAESNKEIFDAITDSCVDVRDIEDVIDDNYDYYIYYNVGPLGIQPM